MATDSLHILELQQWVRRLDVLIAKKNTENNRLDGASQAVAINISTHIEFIDMHIQDVKELVFLALSFCLLRPKQAVYRREQVEASGTD